MPSPQENKRIIAMTGSIEKIDRPVKFPVMSKKNRNSKNTIKKLINEIDTTMIGNKIFGN
jgi:hypothetical protein